MANVISPLEWNGAPLSIPKASATQDGYLSRDDFILFSGGELVPVTSFNTRTGEVVLLEDDVLAALGYVPLNKHGDTMTGPLTLVGPPTAALHAATKAFVESHLGGGASARPGDFFVGDYGASGSKLKFSGSISASSTTLTITGTDFVAGQGISIIGAGPSGQRLVTTVTVVSGTTITLEDAAATTVTAVSNNVQHDDTVAIQAAIDDCFAAGGGDVLFDMYGWYRINKGFSDINSILKIPFNPWITGTVAGPAPPMVRLKANANTPVSVLSPASTLGPIIQTDLVGANSTTSMLSGAAYFSGEAFAGCNQMTVAIEGLTFRTYDNPNICGIDMGMLWNLYLKDVCVDAGMPAESNSNLGGTLPGGSQPTHGTFGIRLPRINACTVVDTNNVSVANFGIGIIGSELWHSNNTWVIRCAVGVQTHETRSNYPITGTLLIVQCTTMMQWLAPVPVDLHIEFESEPGGWWSTILGHFIYDPSNQARGLIRYLGITPGGGNTPISTTGAANVSLWSLGGYGIHLADNLGISGDFTAQNLTMSGNLITGSVATNTLKLNTQTVGVGTDNSAGSGNRVLLVPNSGTFDRLAVPGLIMALQGDAITGLSSGANVATWPDSGPNNYDGTQTNAPNQPTYHPAVVNGHAVARFAGGQCISLTSPGTSAQPHTYYFVMNESVSNTGGWLDSYSNVGARNLLQVPTSLANIQPAAIPEPRDVNAYEMYAGTIVDGGTRIKGSFVIIEAIFDGTSSQLSVNGSVVLTGDVGNQGLAAGVLGCAFSGSAFFTGDIAEFLMYGAVSSGNRTSIRSALGADYGITTT